MRAPSVVVLDYGSGNLRSAERALARAGARVSVTSDPDEALEADGLLVPGVGAFAACVDGIRASGGDRAVIARVERGRPVLGICVGMQILFERGEEGGADGLGLLPGSVVRLDAEVLPHLGWNEVAADPRSVLLDGLDGERFYFVHSYAARDAGDAITSRCEYGGSFVAAFERGPLAGTQFHPEKSGEPGAMLLRSWVVSLRSS